MSDIETHIKKALYESTPSKNVSIDDDVYIKSALTPVHKTLLAIFSMALLLVIIVSQVQIDIMVSSRGELLLETDIERVQHLEGGILDEILISPGESVYAGQVIARLKSIDRDSQLDSSSLDIISIGIELEKYAALITSRNPDFTEFSYSPELVSAGQMSWQQEKEKNDSNLSLISHDIEHKKQLIASMQARIISSQKQLSLIQKQLEIKETLYEEEMASYIDVLNMQIQEMNMLREIESLTEALLNESYQQEHLDKQLANLISNRNSEYQNKRDSLQKEFSLKKAQLPQHTDRVDRLVIHSPVDGIVDKIHFNYKSAVIAPGDSIAEISQLQDTLHAEAKIKRKDLGFVEVGQEVKLKFDTYSFAKYGYLTGTISAISRSSYQEKEAEFYIATIQIDRNYLENGGAKYKLSPYMEFTADIKTGSRKLIEYAIKPVMSAIESAFDER